MNKEFKRRLFCLIGLFLVLMFFLLGSAKKEIDPKDVILGVNVVPETDSASLGSYNLRMETSHVIDNSTGSVKSLVFDNPCVNLNGVTELWPFNFLAAKPGYKWVILESLFQGRCLKLVQK